LIATKVPLLPQTSLRLNKSGCKFSLNRGFPVFMFLQSPDSLRIVLGTDAWYHCGLTAPRTSGVETSATPTSERIRHQRKAVRPSSAAGYGHRNRPALTKEPSGTHETVQDLVWVNSYRAERRCQRRGLRDGARGVRSGCRSLRGDRPRGTFAPGSGRPHLSKRPERTKRPDLSGETVSNPGGEQSR
jgi:hypothetical protein